MGGKQKQSQRTKNNAKPASSGRSGELLTNAFKTESFAGSATGSKIIPNIFPTQAVVGLDHGLNPEINVCIKKLNKKDPITKVKSLQELTDLVKNAKAADVVAMLPAWTHYYKTLSMDYDRKVREGTQVCHGAIVSACGRELAPWLRAITPVWLQARADADGHTQRAALAASPFPEQKLPEVISFCKADIMVQLLENLLGNIDSKLSKKIEDPAERLAQSNRILSSALQAMDYFCRHLPSEHSAWLWEQLAQLLDAPACWKHAHSADVHVRRSWFCCMSGILSACGASAGPKMGPKLLKALLAGPGAAGPGGLTDAAERWSCLLALMTHVPDWEKHLEKKELLTKRIYDILEKGGYGDSHVASVVRALVSRLPTDWLTDHFCEGFFKAALRGLNQKSILITKSSRASWLACIGDCVRQVSKRGGAEGGAAGGAGGVVAAASAAHRAWCEALLDPSCEAPTRDALVTQSASVMADLVRTWMLEGADSLVRNFWSNLGSTAVKRLEPTEAATEDVPWVVEGLVLLLKTLKATVQPKPKTSVRFEDDASSSSEASPAKVVDPTVASAFARDLRELAALVAAALLTRAGAAWPAPPVLASVHELLRAFDDAALLRAMARHAGAASLLQVYRDVLRPRLAGGAGGAARCRAAVDVVFDVAVHMTEEEKEHMYDSFKAFPPSVLEWCILLSMSPSHISSVAGKRWLSGPLAADTLILLTYRAIQMKDERAMDTVVKCLSTKCEDGWAMEGPGVEAACSLAARALPAACGLAARVLAARSPPCAASRQLLLPLCQLLVQPDAELSKRMWQSCAESVRVALAAARRAGRGAERGAGSSPVPAELAPYMQAQLLQPTEELNVQKVKHLLSFCPVILPLSEEPTEDFIKEIVTFSEDILSLPKNEDLPLEFFALRQDCITAKLNCPFENENEFMKKIVEESMNVDVAELSKTSFISQTYIFLFRANYLRSILSGEKENIVAEEAETDDEEKDDEDREKTQTEVVDDEKERDDTWCKVLLKENFISVQFCEMLRDYEIMSSLYDGYVFWSDYDSIQEVKRDMESCIDAIIKVTSSEIRQNILEYLSEKAATCGYYWSYARRMYDDKVNVGSKVSRQGKELDPTKISEIITGSGFFHSLQADMQIDADSMLTGEYQVMLRSLFAAFSDDRAIMTDELVADVVRCHRSDNVDVVINLYYRHNQTMLYGRDISQCSWRHVVYVASVCRTLTQLVRLQTYPPESPASSPLHAPSPATPNDPLSPRPLAKHRKDYIALDGIWHPSHHWDFIAITLVSLLESVDKSKHHMGCTKVALLAHAVLELHCMLCINMAQAVGARWREWEDVFAAPAHAHYWSLVMHALLVPDLRDTASAWHCYRALLSAAPHAACPAAAPALAALLQACGAALLPAPAPPGPPPAGGRMLLAHQLLRSAGPALAARDEAVLLAWDSVVVGADGAEGADGGGEAARDADGAPLELSVTQLRPWLARAVHYLDTVLQDVPLGTAWSPPPTGAAAWRVSGALLLAHRVLALSAAARAQRAHHLLLELRESGLAARILQNSFRLLPAAVWTHAADTRDAPMPQPYLDMFVKEPCFDVTELRAITPVLACRCVLLCTAALGGLLAAFHAACAPHVANKVSRIITTAVSKELVTRQLKSAARVEIEDGQVEIHWSTLEVVLKLGVEQSCLELCVRLSRSHPLLLPAASCSHAAAAEPRWLPAMLAHQNGSLGRALQLWADSTVRRVAAARACYICYSRLADGRLPAARCRHCRNKYHAACLRKWFSSSQKSNCPLCRSNF